MSGTLETRIRQSLAEPVREEVAAFAKTLAQDEGADAVLFYGSNLRTGSLEGVLDFYLLMPGRQQEKIWPRVGYHERMIGGTPLNVGAFGPQGYQDDDGLRPPGAQRQAVGGRIVTGARGRRTGGDRGN